MADFAPPPGPPPPQKPVVPEGWVAQWNEQYKEWFYVNTYSKKSQWEKPTQPAYPPGEEPLTEPPPGYTQGQGPAPTDDKKNPFVEHVNPDYTGAGVGSSSTQEQEDAKLAARLQEEENARASPNLRDKSPYSQQQSLYQQPQSTGSFQDTDKGKGKGFLGKLKAKFGGGPNGGFGPSFGAGGYPHNGRPQQGYYGQQPQYGPVPGYGGGGGGYQQGYGGGYGYPAGYAPQQYPQRRQGGGMGAAGGAALGLGAGLIGGAVIADAIDDSEHDAYQDGYQDGQDGDYGGGGDDFGGGDF